LRSPELHLQQLITASQGLDYTVGALAFGLPSPKYQRRNSKAELAKPRSAQPGQSGRMR